MKNLVKRVFSENLFKDSEGRFKTRWDPEVKNTPSLDHPSKIPDYPVRIDFPINKKRIFDFDLPDQMKLQNLPLQIWSIADGMFSVNQVWIPGPIVIFPQAVFQWHAPRLDDMEDHHLDMLKIIQPRIEYAIIGTGKAKNLNYAEQIRKRFRAIGINLDLCPTVKII